jgi:TPR repeat protein
MLVRAGVVKTSMKEFQKTAVFVDQYVNAHPIFGKRLSNLMIELTNQIYSPQNQGVFPRYGWGRWVINLSKRENTGKPLDLNERLTYDEAKLADKIDHQITYAMMAECESIYSACIKPASLPPKQIAEKQQISSESQAPTESIAKADRIRFEDNKAKAEEGDADAQCNLGDFYYYGKSKDVNWSEGAEWYKKAAEQGHAEAQYKFGIYCGQGGVKDYAEMIKWYHKSANQGYAKAQYSLGFCYAKGQVVTRNYAESVKWLRKAAEQGQRDAQYDLGRCYADGNGVAKNLVEAYKWWNLSSASLPSDVEEFSRIKQMMTPDQIAKAENLIREFKPQKESASGISSSP